jgi:hypothetical protein
MIELFVEWLENSFDFREVTNPTGMRINLTLDIDSHTERMPMQAAAFVAGRDMWQPMGCFEDELFE